MVALATLLSQKESLTYRDIEACLGPRPFAPNAQLSAYVDALPTRDTPHLLPTGGDLQNGSSNPSGIIANSGVADAGTKADDAQLRRDSAQGSEDGFKRGADDVDSDDDDDDSGDGGTGGRGKGGSEDETRDRPRKKKLFGGDDDSCLPELLRKPVTPQPASAASSTSTSVAAKTSSNGA